MITRAKSRLLSVANSANDTDRKPDEAQSRTKDKQETMDTETPSNLSDDQLADLVASWTADITEMKQRVGNLLSQHGNVIQLNPDGSIVIPPQPHDDSNVIPPQPPRPLPNEIVYLVLSHLIERPKTLYQCTLVNKRFHGIATPLLWKVLHFCTDIRTERFLACISDTSPQQQQPLETLGQHIRDLRLDNTHWTDAQLLRLLPHVPHLKHLAIHLSTRITDTSFQHAPQYCQHLTSLQLTANEITQVSLSAVGQYCHQLNDLEWRIWEEQSSEWLDMLHGCPLKRLQLYIHKPLNDNEMTIIKKFDRLTCLDITQATAAPMKPLLLATTTTSANNNNNNNNNHTLENHQNDPHGTTTTSTTTATATVWPQLTKLILSPCYDIDDTTLIGFLKSHAHLQRLELTGASELTDTSLDAMTAWLPQLTHVVFTGNPFISPDGIRRLVQKSPPPMALVELFLCDRIKVQHFPQTLDSTSVMVKLDSKAIEKIKLAQKQ